MADTKISALTEAISLDGTEDIPVVQTSTKRVGVDTLFSSANAKWSGWVYPYTTGWVGTAGQPLTSTAWDGDAYSTVGATLIDLSTVFSVPAGVKAILARVVIRDSGSAGSGTELCFSLGPNNAVALAAFVRVDGEANDMYREQTVVIPCDANGDVYYQVVASGAGTMDVIIRIWGYCL